MVAVALAALCCAALRGSTRLWACIVFTATVGVLLTGLLGAIFRRGERRAFWVGTEVFGWAYMLLVFGPWFKDASGQLLLTTTLIVQLARRTERFSSPDGVHWDGHWYAPFIFIAHLTLALALAALGGLLARYFYQSDRIHAPAGAAAGALEARSESAR
jgi:hypothetical protein